MEHLRSNFCFKLLASIILFFIVMLYSQSFAYTVYYMDAESGITEMSSTTITKLQSLNSKHAVASSYTIANTQENNDAGQEVIDYEQTIITSDGRYMQFLTAMELNGSRISEKECNEVCKILHGDNHVCANVLTASAMVLVYTDKAVEQEETQDTDTSIKVMHKIKIGGLTGNEEYVHPDTYVSREEWQNGTFADLVQNVGAAVGNQNKYAGKAITPTGDVMMAIISASNSNHSKYIRPDLTDYIGETYEETGLNDNKIVTITIYYETAEQELYTSMVYHIIKGGDIKNEDDHVKPIEYFGKGALTTANKINVGVSPVDTPELATTGAYRGMPIEFEEAYYTTEKITTKTPVQPIQINTSGDRGIQVDSTLSDRTYVCEYDVETTNITIYLIEANPAKHNAGYYHESPMKEINIQDTTNDRGYRGKTYVVDISKINIIPYSGAFGTYTSSGLEFASGTILDNTEQVKIHISYNGGIGTVPTQSVLNGMTLNGGEVPLLPYFTYNGKNYTFLASYVAGRDILHSFTDPTNLTCDNSMTQYFNRTDIVQNPVIFAEYTAEGVPVNVHYVATTGEHSAGASNCKSYLTASALKETDVYTASANSTYEVKLQKYINVNNKTYELVNSSVGPNRDQHEGSDVFTKEIEVGTEEVHITAEYKLVGIGVEDPEGPEPPTPPPPGEDVEYRSEIPLKVLNPLATAQISSISRNNSKPTYIWDTTHKYYNFQEEPNGEYYGIATHQNQYVQMLTASRNLFDMTIIKVEGIKHYYTTIKKTYNYTSWNDCWVVDCCGATRSTVNASSSSSTNGTADGVLDSGWHHDTIGCYHDWTVLNNDYQDQRAVDPVTGLLYGYATNSCPNGGTKCEWTYSACCGHKNYCPGHGHWETVPDPPEEDDNDGGDSGGGSHGVSYHSLTHSTPLLKKEWISDPCPAGGNCEHSHNECHNCKRYDYCPGHEDKFCTDYTFYCSANCGGKSRPYNKYKHDYQCEAEECFIPGGNFTVTREYKYKRQYVYYMPNTYDPYMLQSLKVNNETLGASGSVTLDNGASYTLRSELYKPDETWLQKGWSQWSNYHIKDPITEVTKIHDFNEHNETGYTYSGTMANKAVVYPKNWQDHSTPQKLAENQAKIDLGNVSKLEPNMSERTKANDPLLGEKNEDNDFWMIGENCTVLRVRSDYFYHDGLIVKMYGLGGTTEKNVFNMDSIPDKDLSGPSPDPSVNLLSNYAKLGYYITNREGIPAMAEDPEVTTQEYTKNNTTIRSTGERITIHGEDTPKILSMNLQGKDIWDYWYKYQNITIPKTIANNTYGSTASATYVKTSINNPQLPNGSGATTVTATIENFETDPSKVVVHAPVYVKASLNAKYEDTQLILGENAQSKVTNNPLQVDKDYVLTVNTTGTHRSAQGYKNKNYQEWIKVSGNKWMVQASFPYDVYVKEGNDYTFYKKGSWATFDKNDKTLEFKVAVWTEEKAYKNPVTSDVDNPSKASQILNNSIVVRVIAENEPDNLSSQNGVIGRKNANYQKTGEYILYDSQTEGTPYDYRAYDSIDTHVVGKISGLEVEYTDDTGYRYMMQSGFSGVGVEQLPFGQKGDNAFNPYYNNGLLLGNKFKFTVMTKGTKASKVEITPSVYFVTSANDNTGLQEIDLYYRQDGNRYEKLGLDSTLTIYTNMKKPGELPYVTSEMMDLTKQIYDMYKAGTIQDRYWSGKLFSDFNGYDNLKNIGTVGKLTLDEYLRLRIDASKYYEENKIYGNKTASQIIGHAGSVTNFAKSVSEYYGEYMLPSTSVFVKKGTSLYNRTTGKMQNIKTDGYLLVFFNIKAYDNEGKEYLNYQMPVNNTGWQEEGYASEDTFITLPNGKKVTKNIPETTNSGAVVIYEAHLNKDGQVVGKN